MITKTFEFTGTSFKHYVFELLRKDMPRVACDILEEVVGGANEISHDQYIVIYNKVDGEFIVVSLNKNFNDNKLEALVCEIQSELDEMTEGYYD